MAMTYVEDTAATPATIFGGDGDDTIRAGAVADTIDGGRGNDFLFAGGGNDTVRGGDGNDLRSSVALEMIRCSAAMAVIPSFGIRATTMI